MEHQVAGYYQTRYREDQRRDWIWQKITENFLRWDCVPVKGSALDLGCGYGSWIRSLPVENKHAVDINPSTPEIFKNNGLEKVQVHIRPCSDLSPIPTGSLDLVTTSNLLEHLEWKDIHATVREIHRILRKDGSLWIVQPNFYYCYRNYFDDFTHRSVFTHSSIQDLMESEGFRTQKIWPRFLPFSMKTKMSALSFVVPLYLRSPLKPLAGQMGCIFKKN
jgi:SAM-dependent methyltransferase